MMEGFWIGMGIHLAEVVHALVGTAIVFVILFLFLIVKHWRDR